MRHYDCKGAESLALTTYTIDVSSHVSDWSYPAAGHLALSDGVLYIAANSGTLTAIDIGPPPDVDEDGIYDRYDNCPENSNPNQEDTDGDGIGDACNSGIDADNDEWSDELDNCPGITNQDQGNFDGDEFGDVCDPFPSDSDNLGVCLAVIDDQGTHIENLEQQVSLLQDQLRDSDVDSIIDSHDQCESTSIGESVDSSGCSVAQFCMRMSKPQYCNTADWMNNEPLNAHDCRWGKKRL